MFEKLVRHYTPTPSTDRVSNSRHTGLDQDHPWLTARPETNSRSREPNLHRGAEVDYMQTEIPYLQPLQFSPSPSLLW